MKEGRIAKGDFNVSYYRARYFDLRRAFGGNLKLYYQHYLSNGKREGRSASTLYYGGTTQANGVDYSKIYNFNTYITNYVDIKNAFSLDDISTLNHFITAGMAEGRTASAEFSVYAYKSRYADLREAFGNNLKLYYMHYLTYGYSEGRLATP